MTRKYLMAAAAWMALSTVTQVEAAEAEAAPAAAADAEHPSVSEVTVTATRRETSLQSTPVTVSALSAESLEKLNITRVDQVAANVPNFYMQPGVANSSTVSLSLRGRGDNSGGFGTTEQPVSFYFDDVYQARPSAVNSEFTDIERIEVLRGPQGTLFGRNSMTGAVNVISKTPGDDVYGGMSVGYGNFDIFKAKASIGGPIVSGGLAGSLSAVFTDQSKGYMYNVGRNEDTDIRDFFGVRGKLHFYASETWDAVLTASYTDNKNSGFVSSPFNPVTFAATTGDSRDTANQLDSYGRTKATGLAFHVKGDFELFTFKSITGWSQVKDGWDVDLTGGLRTNAGTWVTGYERKSDMDQDQVSQEFQVFGDALGGKLSWIGGLYLFREETSQTFNDRFFLPSFQIFIPVPQISYTNRAKSAAAYAQVSYKITDALEATLGGRFTYEDKKIVGFVNPTTPYQDHTDYNSFTPKFGLNYQMNPDVFLYGSVSKGFKAGGYTSGSSTVIVASTPFNPEEVWSYEVGAKTELLDRRVRLNVALFRNDFKNLLVSRFLPNSAIVVTFNGMSYVVNGIEVELSVAPVQGLQIYVNGGYQNAGNFKFIAGTQVTQPLSIPNYSGSVGFSYEQPVGDFTLRFGADYVMRDSFYGTLNQAPVSKYSAIRELNAQVSLASDNGWELRAVGRNLTNKLEWQNSLDFVSFLGTATRQPMLPRTYAVELSYKF